MVGVCMAALGYECYGSYALNLAMSLKVCEPKTQIALVCDEEAIHHLSESELTFFDFIIPVKENLKSVGYQKIKLLINNYTPFESTIYMDVDSIWFDKKLSEIVFDTDFKIGLAGFYDINKKKRPTGNYTFWGIPEQIIKYHSLTNNIPQTVSGFYYFKKTDFTNKVFELALQVYEDEKAPTIKWSNGKADEYCFNVALSKLGYEQDNLEVFYFDKQHGRMDVDSIYEHYQGIAMGGNRVKKVTSDIYDKLVNRNCQIAGITTRHYHKNKADILKERLKN